MELGGAPPTEPGRREKAGEVGLFLACLLVLVVGALAGLWLVAQVLLKIAVVAQP